MTYLTSEAIMFKAGDNVSNVSNEHMSCAVFQAEALINVTCRKDWTAAYAGLSDNVKYLLEEVGSNLAASYIICKDMSGYTSRYEAETMLDVLRDGALRGLSILRDTKQQDFMDGA